jgi:hypothetical protein
VAGAPAPAAPAASTGPVGPVTGGDYLAGAPRGEASFAAVCARGNADPITEKLCASPRPPLTSLVDVQRALGLDFKPGDEPYFAVTGNSTGLTTRSVSGANPRAIIFTPYPKRAKGVPFVAMGYSRGEQGIELAARDAKTRRFVFFLLRYEQACNATKSCTNYDLLGPDTEKGFTTVSLYQDVDLKNTVLDCLQCHQPEGPNGKTILRMQEISAPWTHWFLTRNASGLLFGDFKQVHGDSEVYAGIPPKTFFEPNRSLPPHLEDLVRTESNGDKPGGVDPPINFSGADQPNAYDSVEINERGNIATWRDQYRKVLAGEVIPMPYHEIRVHDMKKVAAAAKSYQDAASGAIPRAKMLDLRDVFDDKGLADMNFVPQPNLDGKGVMRQICQHCHNAKLDQTISRARFDVTKLDTLSRAEKDVAIARLMMPADSPLVMPPRLFATLPDAARAAVIAELKK